MKKYYYIYKITNLINGHFYIGKRTSTKLPNSDTKYMGSSTLLNKAIKKYGKAHFIKDILFECNSLDELNHKEANIVDEKFIKRHDTYNAHLGGKGGWDHINKGKPSSRKNLITIQMKFKKGELVGHPASNKSIIHLINMNKSGLNKGKKLTITTKNKISKKLKGNKNYLSMKTVVIKLDAKSENEAFTTTLGNIPIDCIKLKDWKIKQKSNNLHWYNDGNKNYLITEEKAFGLNKGRILRG